MIRTTPLRLAAAGAALVAFGALALPALGQAARPSADTSVAPAAAPTGDPGASPRTKPGKGPKADRPAETPVTLTGRVGTRTDGGSTVYTLTVGTTVYELEAGPPWWWGDTHPLAALVGKTVTITGERADGSTSVDVLTVDGKAVREPGRPPWAGGWKVVGPKHPGWAQWKADKAEERGPQGHGRPSWAGPKGSPEPSETP